MALRKEFLSLRKLRVSGVVPQNRLNNPVLRIVVPTAAVSQADALRIVNPLNMAEETPSLVIKSCTFITVALVATGLADSPLWTLDLGLVNYNGTQVLTAEGQLKVALARDEHHVFVKKGSAFVDKLVFPEHAIASAYFDESFSSAVLVLAKNFGVVYLGFTELCRALRNFFHKNEAKWLTETVKSTSLAELEQIHQYYLKKRESLNRDPHIVIRSTSDGDSPKEQEEVELPTESDNVLLSGLPSVFRQPKNPSPSRTTRLASKRAILEKLANVSEGHTLQEHSLSSNGTKSVVDADDEPIIRETPAPFEPPLRHEIDLKKFIISYNDFRTLYNNDWINDTLIDFFIACEVETAVKQLKLVASSDLHVFNSFFFTKLSSKPEGQAEPLYYDNIRRWLLKIDLMAYQRVIIPINEHLHWYFVIITNLPRLLQHTKRAQSGLPPDSTKPKSKAHADVFIVDSLRQTHSNIMKPLRRMLADYCQERHGVQIDTKLIRSYLARVPRQQNFNDCGIHVIYNIRKWLAFPDLCESFWKRHSRPQNIAYSVSERNGMRKACIDMLLDLHSRQPKTPSDSETRMLNQDEHSDDEIEEISYHPSVIVSQEAVPQEAPAVDDSGLNGDKGSHECAAHVDNRKPLNEHPMRGTATILTADASGIVMNSPHSKLPSTKSSSIASTNQEPVSKASPIRQASPLGQSVRGTETHSPRLGPRSPNVMVKVTPKGSPATLIAQKTLNDDNYAKEELDIFELKPVGLQEPDVIETDPVDLRHSTPTRTLDPRALQGTPSDAPPGAIILLVEHPQIRRLLIRTRLSQHTIDFLNSFFHNHQKVLKQEKHPVLHEFVRRYNTPGLQHKPEKLRVQEEKFREALKEPKAPMEEPFAILESEDSGCELNQSVSDLRISNESRQRHTELGKPLRPEESSVEPDQVKEDSPSTNLRARRSHVSVQIVEDDLEILSELDSTVLNTSQLEGYFTHKRHDEDASGKKRVVDQRPQPTHEIVQVSDEGFEAKAGRMHRADKRRFAWSSPKRRRVDES